MEIFQIVFLALIQGLTEFLPVSSSAHLILPSQLLGWPDQGLAFDVAVHVGTLLAVLTYFRQDVRQLLAGVVGYGLTRKPTPESRLAMAIVVGTIPAGLAGLIFNDFIEDHLRSTAVIAGATLFFGGLLYLAARSGREAIRLGGLTLKDALVIGCAQALALIPGTSRSGITMTAALMLGYKRTDAARFSFLLSIPIIAAAGGYQGFQLWLEGSESAWLAVGLGFGVAFVSAYLCIHWFLRLLERIGFVPFVIYRLILGTVLVFLMLTGFA